VGAVDLAQFAVLVLVLVLCLGLGAELARVVVGSLAALTLWGTALHLLRGP
jgi:hypothetical protein